MSGEKSCENCAGNVYQIGCSCICGCKDFEFWMSVEEPVHSEKQIEESGQWDAITKKEMWETIQEIRKLVGSDGTRSIISDIEAYAERYSKHQHEMAMLFAKLTRAATDFIDQNGCKAGMVDC